MGVVLGQVLFGLGVALPWRFALVAETFEYLAKVPYLMSNPACKASGGTVPRANPARSCTPHSLLVSMQEVGLVRYMLTLMAPAYVVSLGLAYLTRARLQSGPAIATRAKSA